ncbi:MAG: hypothetical protein ACRD2N_21895 [Vicinamibacterales bacterium]
MLPSLLAHGVLLTAFVWASFATPVGRRSTRSRSSLAWFILLIGYAIGVTHGGAFPYFWMTLGVFPAVALGMAWGCHPPIVFTGRAMGTRRGHRHSPRALTATTYAQNQREDTQRVQRHALAFIERALPGARGFHAEGALFCRPDPDPFPVYFADGVIRRPAGGANAEAFIDEFRSRPVSFMIAHRLFSFPEPIDEFWKSHYVLYRDEVMLPGRELRASRGDTLEFDVVVPGQYRWHAKGRLQCRSPWMVRRLTTANRLS